MKLMFLENFDLFFGNVLTSSVGMMNEIKVEISVIAIFNNHFEGVNIIFSSHIISN